MKCSEVLYAIFTFGSEEMFTIALGLDEPLTQMKMDEMSPLPAIVAQSSVQTVATRKSSKSQRQRSGVTRVVLYWFPSDSRPSTQQHTRRVTARVNVQREGRPPSSCNSAGPTAGGDERDLPTVFF